ncbi:MAG: hypothetical protein AB7O59_04705 [Pirellulales bacterium]
MFRKSLLVILSVAICSLPFGCSSQTSTEVDPEVRKQLDEGIAKARKAKEEQEAKGK